MADINETIAVLLQKTEANGASEAEAEGAMRLAKKLMSKHGVTLEDIYQKTDAAVDFATMRMSFARTKSLLDKFLAADIAKFCDCEAVANRHRIDGKIYWEVVFFGYRVDVELANYIYKVCGAALDGEWDKYKVTLPSGDRAKRRVTFMLGMIDRLTERLEVVEEETPKTGTDLIVLKNQLVTVAFETSFPGAKASNAVVKYNDDHRVYADGYAAGDNVRFNREVGQPRSSGRITVQE